MFKRLVCQQHILSTTKLTQKSYVTLKYPFKEYNPFWNQSDLSIKPAAVPAKALQTFPMAHDLLKLLIAKQDMENLARITRPRIFKELSDFISNVKKEGLTTQLVKGDNPYTSVETVYRIDHLIGVEYTETDVEKYNIQNLLEKKYFKKVLFTPKSGVLDMNASPTIIVIDVLFNSSVKVAVLDSSQKVVAGSQGDTYEKILLQFTAKNKYKEKPFLTSFSKNALESEPQDFLDFGWKISNINHLLDDSKYENLFN